MGITEAQGRAAMDILIHGANVIYLVSYLMRDILWLRVFTVIAAICLMAFFFFRPVPELTPIYWNVLFVLLNLYWIVLLILERRPVKLSADELTLCDLVFRTITPREMIKLLKLGTWDEAEAEECFLAHGSALDRLIVIFSGKACIKVDGKSVAELYPGQFIGSISFITDDTARGDIVALEPTRYVSWPAAELKKYLKANPELHAAIQATLSSDLSRILSQSWSRQGEKASFG